MEQLWHKLQRQLTQLIIIILIIIAHHVMYRTSCESDTKCITCTYAILYTVCLRKQLRKANHTCSTHVCIAQIRTIYRHGYNAKWSTIKLIVQPIVTNPLTETWYTTWILCILLYKAWIARLHVCVMSDLKNNLQTSGVVYHCTEMVKYSSSLE